MSTTQGNVLETEVTDYAVKSKKEMVQEQVLDTAIRLKTNCDICKICSSQSDHGSISSSKRTVGLSPVVAVVVGSSSSSSRVVE